MAILIVFIFIAVLSGCGGFLFYIIKIQPKKMKEKQTDFTTSQSSVLTTTEKGKEKVQDQLPFETIEDSVIDLGGCRYRAIIEVSSLNYDLLSEEEQNRLEYDFKSLINACDFPIAFCVQTKELDIKEIIDITKKDVEKVTQQMPYLSDYGQAYYQSLYQHISPRTGNTSKVKKKFVIVGSENNNDTNFHKLPKEAKVTNAFYTLNNRCHTILEGLSNMGLNAEVLDTQGVIDVLFHSLNNSQGTLTEGIANGSYFNQIVSGSDLLHSPLTDGDIVHFIDQMIKKISNFSENDRSLSEAKRFQIDELSNELRAFRNNHLSVLSQAESVYNKKKKIMDEDHAAGYVQNDVKTAASDESTNNQEDVWIEL